MRALLMLALVALGLVVAVVGAHASGSPPSGLYGVVVRGPTTPVCREGDPCEAPAPGVTLTFSRAGRAWSTRTDQRGAYRIRLAPGIYAVRTSAKPFGQTPRPGKVHVRAGHMDRLVFTIDTGIR